MNGNTSIAEIAFKVHAKLRMGEEVRLSGNVPSLGCDDPDRAIRLVTKPSVYPWWKTVEALYLPDGGNSVRYRYCVYSGGKFDRWEGNGKIFRTLDTESSDKILQSTTDIFGELMNGSALPSIAPPSSSVLDNTLKSRKFAAWSRKCMKDIHLSPQDGVVIVSYVLPVILSRSPNGQWSAEWDRENILALSLNMRVTWVGTVRYGGQVIPAEEEDAVSRVLLEKSCYPIFINASMHYQFYDVFCKKHLWLMMHHVADVYGPINLSDIGAKGQQDLWFIYSTVNRLFRDKIVEVFHHGDMVWIHGFHFMLLPTYLRRTLQYAKIGYFFHTPFSSSEIWRTITRREDLVRGLLGADHIGFHLYEYARHFRSVCHRILGHTSQMNSAGNLTVSVDGREVAITCIHVGVDLMLVQSFLEESNFENESLKWRQKFSGKIVVSGIDRLERLKGIPLKLIAISKFFEEYPQWRNKIVFAIIGISANERGIDYRQTQHDLKIMVSDINSKFGGGPNDPVVYFEEFHERNMRLPDRLPFFAATDILLTSAARDGLNRLPMEFTLAKQKASTLSKLHSGVHSFPNAALLSRYGLIIISEFMSSARVMRGAVTINPWKTHEIKEALNIALNMQESELADRTRRNLEFSTRLTTEKWAQHVLLDLKSVERSDEPMENFSLGFGMGYRVMGVKTGFDVVDVVSLSRAYRSSHSRLIVLDWGGTLVAESEKSDKVLAYAVAKGHAQRSGPTPELKETLEKLCADPKNIVFVVSGKEVHPVAEFFGDVKGLGLGAEHGFYYRWPRENAHSSNISTQVRDNMENWRTIMSLGNQEWKESAKYVMDIYVQRTHGTYIEVKGSALIWQFRDADPEFGLMQSHELEENLKAVLVEHGVEVIRGGGVADGYIEVRPAGVSKGLFVQHITAMLKAHHREVDFVLAIGDDSSDEPMFREVNRMKEVGQILNPSNSFTVTVGKKPSAAQSYVADTVAVMDLLVTLNRLSQRESSGSSSSKKYHSVEDLTSFATTDATKRATFSQLYKGPGGLRPTSANSLSALQEESITAAPIAALKPDISVNTHGFIGKTLLESPMHDFEQQLSGNGNCVPTLKKSASKGSNPHLCFSDYLDSVQTTDEGNDSGGIFF